MKITIRNEQEKDFMRVEEVTRNAFWNLYFPGAHEHFVVHEMRQHEDFIKELAFVLEVDGVVEGAIFYTHSKIVLANGEEFKTISFGPVCISPHLHRQGLGRKLIEHSIEAAKKLGHKAMIILGYPYHYKTYGFVGAKAYNISMGDGKFYKGLMALPLQDGALSNLQGHAEFSPVFEVNPVDVDAYDEANFAPKPKKEQASQKEFELACAELDD